MNTSTPSSMSKCLRVGSCLATILVLCLLMAAPAVSQRVTIDPETGDFVDSPPPGGSRSSVAPFLSTSQEGLEQVFSPVPGGGVMVDLKGRFRQVMKATIGPDGRARVYCEPSTAAAGEGR